MNIITKKIINSHNNKRHLTAEEIEYTPYSSNSIETIENIKKKFFEYQAHLTLIENLNYLFVLPELQPRELQLLQELKEIFTSVEDLSPLQFDEREIKPIVDPLISTLISNINNCKFLNQQEKEEWINIIQKDKSLALFAYLFLQNS